MDILQELGLTEDDVREASGLPPAPPVTEGDRSEALWQALDFERFVNEGLSSGLLPTENAGTLREWAGREVARARGGLPRGGRDRLAEALRDHGISADAVREEMDAPAARAERALAVGGRSCSTRRSPGWVSCLRRRRRSAPTPVTTTRSAGGSSARGAADERARRAGQGA